MQFPLRIAETMRANSPIANTTSFPFITPIIEPVVEPVVEPIVPSMVEPTTNYFIYGRTA